MADEKRRKADEQCWSVCRGVRCTKQNKKGQRWNILNDGGFLNCGADVLAATVTGEEQPTPGSPKTEEQPTPGSSGSPQTEEQQAAKPQEESTAQESTTILGQAQETVEKLDVLGVGKTDVAQQTQVGLHFGRHCTHAWQGC
eukprot:2861598-Rhodomonas_salina.1